MKMLFKILQQQHHLAIIKAATKLNLSEDPHYYFLAHIYNQQQTFNYTKVNKIGQQLKVNQFSFK